MHRQARERAQDGPRACLEPAGFLRKADGEATFLHSRFDRRADLSVSRSNKIEKGWGHSRAAVHVASLNAPDETAIRNRTRNDCFNAENIHEERKAVLSIMRKCPSVKIHAFFFLFVVFFFSFLIIAIITL